MKIQVLWDVTEGLLISAPEVPKDCNAFIVSVNMSK